MTSPRLADIVKRALGDGRGVAGGDARDPAAAAAHQLELILENVGDAITVQRRDGTLVFANAAAARMLGLESADSVLTASSTDRMAPFEVLDAAGNPLPLDELPGRIAFARNEDVERTIRYRVRATGQELWSIVRASPVPEPDGPPELVINTFHDITERVRAEQRLRFLAEASVTVSRSLDWETTLANVARLAIPTLADWCIVDVISDDGTTIRQVAVAAADPRKEDVLREMRARYQPTLDSPQPAARALRSGGVVHFPSFSRETLAETVRDEEHLKLLETLAPRAAIAVPLVARDTTVGVITLAWAESARSYEAADIALAEELARRAALAVENVRLYRTERETRAAAERARENLRFLAEASEVLAGSLDYETTLARVADLAVPRLADTCLIDVLNPDDTTRALAAADARRDDASELLALRREYPPASPTHPVRLAMSTGESHLLPELSEEQLAEIARDERHAELLRYLYNRPGIVIPLVARGRTLGALTLAGESDEIVSESHVTLAQELARRAAVAIDNARLYGLAQESARESAETASLLDTLLATAPIGLAFLDRDFRFVRINDALASLNGVPAEEHLGRTVAEVVPELAPQLTALWRQVVASGEPLLDLELTGPTPGADGELLHWLGSYYPVRSADGETIGIGAVVVDVTERRRSEETQRFMAEASTILGSSLDYETTLARVAELAVPRLADWCTIDMLGEGGAIERLAVAHVDPAKVALAHELQERFAPEPDAPIGVPNVLRTGRSELFTEIPEELLVEAVEGDEALLGILRDLGLKSSMCVPLVARDRVFGAITFISERSGRRFDDGDLALAEELARRAAIAVDNARLFSEAERRGDAARVLAHVGDGVFLLDRNGVVRLWNPAAEMITGLTASEVVGRAVGEAVPGWSAVADRVPVAAASGAGAARAETVPLELPDRELWLSVAGVGFDDGIVYAFRDLTEERALEEMKTDFVSTVSHELRTPLAAIYGAALTLRRSDLRLDEEQRENLLNVVASEADRLARTVNDILWASRLDSGTLHVAIESCDPVELARGVIAAAEAHAPDAIRLHLAPQDGLPQIAADPDKVRQVLVNFVDNAVKYSPDGGSVEVAVERQDGMVRFAVRDEGLGIPHSEQRRIFDKFYRLDPNMTRGVGGTGLGLYICRELVQRMDGRIWVESRGEGCGSTFAFELPTVDG